MYYIAIFWLPTLLNEPHPYLEALKKMCLFRMILEYEGFHSVLFCHEGDDLWCINICQYKIATNNHSRIYFSRNLCRASQYEMLSLLYPIFSRRWWLCFFIGWFFLLGAFLFCFCFFVLLGDYRGFSQKLFPDWKPSVKCTWPRAREVCNNQKLSKLLQFETKWNFTTTLHGYEPRAIKKH